MNANFHGDIGIAHRALEERLRSDREKAIAFLEARPHKMAHYDFMLDSLIFVTPPADHPPISSRKHLDGRVPVPLSNGYLAKFVPAEELSNVFFYHMIGGCPKNQFEEENVKVLRDFGLTQENGFYVPEHKVIGLSMQGGLPTVDPTGYGWVIVEDVSEGGKFEVTDVMPHHFITLDNAAEFLDAYRENLQGLLAVYNDPGIDPSVYRHGTPKHPTRTLSRMLLAKVGNNRGEVVIGDLNNVRFDRK